VHANSRIVRGTPVQVKCEELIAEGVVRHSRKFKGEYSIGVEFLRIGRIASKSILSMRHMEMGNAQKSTRSPNGEHPHAKAGTARL
jgi:hypothetical protein